MVPPQKRQWSGSLTLGTSRSRQRSDRSIPAPECPIRAQAATSGPDRLELERHSVRQRRSPQGSPWGVASGNTRRTSRRSRRMDPPKQFRRPRICRTPSQWTRPRPQGGSSSTNRHRRCPRRWQSFGCAAEPWHRSASGEGAAGQHVLERRSVRRVSFDVLGDIEDQLLGAIPFAFKHQRGIRRIRGSHSP